MAAASSQSILRSSDSGQVSEWKVLAPAHGKDGTLDIPDRGEQLSLFYRGEDSAGAAKGSRTFLAKLVTSPRQPRCVSTVPVEARIFLLEQDRGGLFLGSAKS